MINSAAASRLLGSASRRVHDSRANDVGADVATDIKTHLPPVCVGDVKRTHALGSVAGGGIRAGRLLRAVKDGLIASQPYWFGLTSRGMSVDWSATRMLSHVSGGNNDRCGNWRTELQQRERDLDAACQQELDLWLRLNRAIESACHPETVGDLGLRPGSQSKAQWGNDKRLDVWLDDLGQLLKARYASHRRLSFLQREHDNIRLTLSAFERASPGSMQAEKTGLIRPNLNHHSMGLAGDQRSGGLK